MSELTAVRTELAGPPPVNEDPDFDMWFRYWQEMREESLHHVAAAFDSIAKDFANGDARAAVDILIFCADESNHAHPYGIYHAIGVLLGKYNRDLQAADEIRAGSSMREVVDMVNTR